MKWWMFHCQSWTPHPMEKKATIVDDHGDDVIDVNASGDEYTDCPGVLCHKTTRDQFLSWEYTGISPSMLSLSGLVFQSLSGLFGAFDHSSVLCVATTTTTCYCMWQL